MSSTDPFAGRNASAQESQELLEDLLAMARRQTHLLEEIRDMLAAAQTQRRRRPASKPQPKPDYD